MGIELGVIDIERIASDLLGCSIKAIPIGHHDLKRHYVYKLVGDKVAYVFKVYYRRDRYKYDVLTIRLLKGVKVPCPRIYHWGSLEDGCPWIIMNYLDGVTLEDIKDTLSLDEELKILRDMGINLATIHGKRTFDFYGKWEDRKLDRSKSYKETFIHKCQGIFASLRRHPLAERELLEESISKLIDRFDVLDQVVESVLCHNDYDYRNILVSPKEGYRISGIIDFEQSQPSDRLSDVIALYHKVLRHDKRKFDAFNEGYRSTGQTMDWNPERVEFYIIYASLLICSFAHFAAKDYYKYGIELLKGVDKGSCLEYNSQIGNDWKST